MEGCYNKVNYTIHKKNLNYIFLFPKDFYRKKQSTGPKFQLFPGHSSGHYP